MIYFVFAILIILIDRGIKIWASTSIYLGQVRDFIPGILRLTHVENTGAAFSIFSDMRWPLVVVSSVAVVLMVLVILFYRDGELGRLAASFMLGGAVGNLVDRIYTGKVVDMFEPEFINFAVFNVADIFVTVGCFMFIGHLIHLMLVHSRAKKSVSSAQAAVSKPAKQQLPQTPPASGDERQELSKIMVDYYLEQGLDDRDG